MFLKSLGVTGLFEHIQCREYSAVFCACLSFVMDSWIDSFRVLNTEMPNRISADVSGLYSLELLIVFPLLCILVGNR